MTPADILRQALDAQGVTDPTTRAAIAAIAGGESGFASRSETTYAHTSNERIREIFGSRVAGLSNDALDRVKASDETFFDLVYGGAWGVHNLGNTEPGDGYRYRGRGLFQLTGKSNFERYGRLTGHPELVDNPDLANDPAIAAAIAVAYMKDRYKGGGWSGMKRAVGNSVAGVGKTKDRLFQHYLATGEFAVGAA